MCLWEKYRLVLHEIFKWHLVPTISSFIDTERRKKNCADRDLFANESWTTWKKTICMWSIIIFAQKPTTRKKQHQNGIDLQIIGWDFQNRNSPTNFKRKKQSISSLSYALNCSISRDLFKSCTVSSNAFLEIENFICSDKRDGYSTYMYSDICVASLLLKSFSSDFIHGMSSMY